MTRHSGRIIKEPWIRRIWQEQSFSAATLFTHGGVSVHVLSPGIPAREEGPDFRGALISFGKAYPIRGDVEVHVYTRDWIRHGHGKDPRYENVILHIVYENDTHLLSLHGPSGQLLPTLEVKPYLTRPLPLLLDQWKRRKERQPMGHGFCPRRDQQPRQAILLDHFKALGKIRFQDKVDRLRLWRRSLPDDEILYRAIFEALGYAKCRRPVLELAMAVPLSSLRRFLLDEKTARDRIQQTLLETAGLAKDTNKAILSESDWKTPYSRPFNKPRKRVLAMADLVVFLGKASWIETFSKPFSCLDHPPSTTDLQRIAAQLCQILIMREAQDHHPRLLGKERSKTVVFNAILPALVAIHGTVCHTGQWAYQTALHHPALPGNRISRLMEQTFLSTLPRRPTSYGLIQLGMIELMRSHCQAIRNRCESCPIMKGIGEPL